MVKLDPLRDLTWFKFRDDGKHIKEEHVKLFASLLIDSLKEAHGLPTRHQKKHASGQQHQHKTPLPLMGKIISMPSHQYQPTIVSTAPIGQRLQNIAGGSNGRVVQKQNLMSKLAELMTCLEGW